MPNIVAAKWISISFFSYLLFLLLLVQQVSSSKINISVPVLAPMYDNGITEYENDRFGYKTAMSYAFKLINKRHDILRDYNLVPDFYDTGVSMELDCLQPKN